MKASIRDVAALNSLRQPNIVGYLRSRGWSKIHEISGKLSVWGHENYSDAEIVVPLRREAPDFVNRLSEIVAELESVENRSQFEIMRDLISSGYDLIRFGVKSPNTDSGSVRILDGVRIVDQASEILLAAACSAVKPRAVFHSRKPQQAIDYMHNARLGQTEHGSFVLTILSPVAPQLAAYGESDLFPEEPFERRVVATLATAVSSAVLAAEESFLREKQDFSPFEKAVENGVSANLCEGLAGLVGDREDTSIFMSVAWALNRPTPDLIPYKTIISPDVVPVIREAARVFRAHDSIEDYAVSGPVVKLERADGEDVGKVTIYAIIEGVPRKVRLNLSGADYETAVSAHQHYRSVKVVGTLVREGRFHRVAKPLGFSLIDDDD